MDFIKHLLESEGYMAILVIVDRFTKQSIFIPTYDTVTSAQLAELFVIHVFSRHGVPMHVTSDQGSEFVLHFFRSLGKALDITLHFTSGYHPEGDRQIKCVNQTLEQYLCIYCNYQQNNWKSLLPLAEFTYNNALNATISVSPFHANKGYNPNLTVHSEQDLVSARAHEFVTDLDELYQELQIAIKFAQEQYQCSTDKHRLPSPNFKIGDRVFVKAKFFQTTRPCKKLGEKYFGLFEIIAQAGSVSWTLQLLKNMRSDTRSCHVSMLEPSVPNTIPEREQPPPPPVKVGGDAEFEVAEILDSEIDNHHHMYKLLYLVKWAGYEGTDEDFMATHHGAWTCRGNCN
jgi:hypothetical protein